MKPLQNKIALITGSSRGIGRSIALKLAQEGASVIIHYAYNDKAAEETLQSITAENQKAWLAKAELSSMEGVESLVTQVGQILKNNKLDILINNAGTIVRSPLEKISEPDFDQMFNVNVKAPYFLTSKLLSKMNEGGRIINLSSQVSLRPRHEVGAYSMTKAAIDNFTVSLASVLGQRKITVNSIAPGVIDTDMNKEKLQNPTVRKTIEEYAAMKRIGNADDIANAVFLLTLPESGWITAQVIEASGGAGIIHV